MANFQMQTKYGDNINLSCIIDEDDIALETLFAYFVKMTNLTGYSQKSWANILKSLTDTENDCLDYMFEWAEEVIFDYEYDKEKSGQN